ncbi:MAG: hypothetical protein Q9201_003910 [Fulgogasparrea decipioides]
MRGAVHDTFVQVTIHTAKCDVCNKHNTSTMYRCIKCGYQRCTPCWERKGGDGRHQLHNKEKIVYTGPRAEALPPPEDQKAANTGQSVKGSKRRRSEAANAGETAVSAAGSPAHSATSTKDTEEAVEVEKKRARHASVGSRSLDEDEHVTGEEDITHGTHDKQISTTTTTQDAPVVTNTPPTKEANSNAEVPCVPTCEYPPSRILTSVHQHRSEARKSSIPHNTPKHKSASPELSRDHKGLNTIVEAVDLLERSSACNSSATDRTCPVAAGTPASQGRSKSASNATHQLKTPEGKGGWTPVNAGYSALSVRTPKHGSNLSSRTAGVTHDRNGGAEKVLDGMEEGRDEYGEGSHYDFYDDEFDDEDTEDEEVEKEILGKGRTEGEKQGVCESTSWQPEGVPHH